MGTSLIPVPSNGNGSTTEIYGRGFQFPFQFDPTTGGVKAQRYQALVACDLLFLLGTTVGELPMQPTFGSKINQVVFMLNGPEQYTLLKAYITEAAQQDPRVDKVTSIAVVNSAADPNAIDVPVTYTLINQTTPQNLVLPLISGTS